MFYIQNTSIMNITLSPSWVNGNYIVNGFQVTIKSHLSIARFRSLDNDDDYYFQGNEADDVINEIFDIWNKSDIPQDEAVGQWISMHL